MNQKSHALLSGTPIAILALCATFALLSACGGGGGGGTPTYGSSNTVTVPSPTGSIAASFVATASGPKFFIVGTPGTAQLFSPAGSWVQAAGGAMTALGSYTLSGNPNVTQDISGDANYAMGRWVWGTVTNTATSSVLDTMNGTKTYEAWHYVQTNSLTVLPTTGTKVCDNGTFTKATYQVGALPGGLSASDTATTVGSAATLSFTATGANLAFTLTSTANAASNVANISLTNVTLGGTALSGGWGGGMTGAWIALGDGGAGAVRINGIYDTTINGVTYFGVLSFKCI